MVLPSNVWALNLQSLPGKDPRAVRVGARIRAARDAKGVTQSQLARAIEVPDSYISRWERGDNMPSWDNLEAIAAELGVTLGSLVERPMAP